MHLPTPHTRLRRARHGAYYLRVALLDVRGSVRRGGLRGELRVESADLVPATAVNAEPLGREQFVAGLGKRC